MLVQNWMKSLYKSSRNYVDGRLFMGFHENCSFIRLQLKLMHDIFLISLNAEKVKHSSN